MNYPPRKRTLFLIVLGLLGALAGQVAGQPLRCPPGIDPFVTPDSGHTQFPCPECDPLVIPEGFFGSVGGFPSDPMVFGPSPTTGTLGPIVVAGDPTGCPDPGTGCVRLVGEGCHQGHVGRHCTEEVVATAGDTCVERLEEFTLNNVGSSVQIPIEIVSLSLKSVEPITVTYGQMNPTLFDVFITLDPNEDQDTGLGTFTRTGPAEVELEVSEEVGGGLPVNVRAEFRPVQGGSPFFMGLPPDNLSTVPPPGGGASVWRVLIRPQVPALATWGLLALALVMIVSLTWMMRRRRVV